MLFISRIVAGIVLCLLFPAAGAAQWQRLDRQPVDVRSIAADPLSGDLYVFERDFNTAPFSSGAVAYGQFWRKRQGEWLRLSAPVPAETAVTDALMAFDSGRGRLYIFASLNRHGVQSAALLVFSGERWSTARAWAAEEAPSFPDSLAYNAADGRIYLINERLQWWRGGDKTWVTVGDLQFERTQGSVLNRQRLIYYPPDHTLLISNENGVPGHYSWTRLKMLQGVELADAPVTAISLPSNPEFCYSEKKNQLLVVAEDTHYGEVSSTRTFAWQDGAWRTLNTDENLRAASFYFDEKRNRYSMPLDRGAEKRFASSNWKISADELQPPAYAVRAFSWCSRSEGEVAVAWDTQRGVDADTWFLDKKGWRKRSFSGPPYSERAFLIDDPDQQRLVLLVSHPYDSRFTSGIWSWSGGNAWTRLPLDLPEDFERAVALLRNPATGALTILTVDDLRETRQVDVWELSPDGVTQVRTITAPVALAAGTFAFASESADLYWFYPNRFTNGAPTSTQTRRIYRSTINNWKRLRIKGMTPKARSSNNLFALPVAGTILFYGGEKAWDLWSFDPVALTWTNRSEGTAADSPSCGFYGFATWDPEQGALLLYNGSLWRNVLIP